MWYDDYDFSSAEEAYFFDGLFGDDEEEDWEEDDSDWDDDPWLEVGFNPYEGCYDYDC